MVQQYPISMRKATDYWHAHQDEQIDINEREPQQGEHIVYLGKHSGNVLGFWKYGVWPCVKEEVIRWMPMNKEMEYIY